LVIGHWSLESLDIGKLFYWTTPPENRYSPLVSELGHEMPLASENEIKRKNLMKELDIRPSQAHLSRRSFLKTSSTAMAGGALLGALPVERFALGASPGDTIKLALVGCGGRGSGAADQALSTTGGGKLVAVADAFKDRIEGGPRNLEKEH